MAILDAVSGTVGEIECALEQGKPVHLYFSTAPLPNDVDTEQLEGLRAFKAEIGQRGLLGEFSNVSQLEHEVWRAIEYDIPKFSLGVPMLNVPTHGVKFSVQPKQERELKGHDKKGKSQYRNRRWIEVTNTGDQDAEEVTFESVGPQSGMGLGGDRPTVIHAGQTRSINVTYSMGGSDPHILRIRWIENGEEKCSDFHVG